MQVKGKYTNMSMDPSWETNPFGPHRGQHGSNRQRRHPSGGTRSSSMGFRWFVGFVEDKRCEGNISHNIDPKSSNHLLKLQRGNESPKIDPQTHRLRRYLQDFWMFGICFLYFPVTNPTSFSCLKGGCWNHPQNDLKFIR